MLVYKFFNDFSVPPQEPVITEPPGLHPVTELGPYPEGYLLRLRCIVRGGKF